jgi:hypothetical protein
MAILSNRKGVSVDMTLVVPPSVEALKKLSRFRLAIVQANPIRKWEIDGKAVEFNRGSNHTKGLYMSNLGAFIRHIFFDKKTQVLYELDGILNRREALIEDPEFLGILAFEWRRNMFYSPYIPNSLENLARVYKHLIQNVIEPDLDLDHLKTMVRNAIQVTFGAMTVSSFAKGYEDANPEYVLKKREEEYRAFGQTLCDLADQYKKYKPDKALIVKDMSDYSLEKEYQDPARRLAAIKKILDIV